MPYTFDSSLFPMPTLQQGSPFGGVLSDAIAKRLARAKAESAEAEVPYAGLSKLSQIMSQSAYAGAVTPQFRAKLLGVKGAIPNLEHPQTTLNALEGIGTNGSSGNGLQDYINKELIKIASNGNAGAGNGTDLGQRISNFIHANNQQEQPANDNGYGYVDPRVPQDASQPAPTMPVAQPAQPPIIPVPQNPRGRSPESVAYSKNEQDYNKDVAKGTALGTKQGEQQSEYGPATQGIISQKNSLDELNKIYSDPFIKKAGNVPFATKYSIPWYKQSGNEAEQKKIGKMESAENAYIAASFSLFPRGPTDKDMAFLFRMKPNENDPLPVRQGKIDQIGKYAQHRLKQIILSDKYMSKGDSQAQAEYKADKEIRLDEFKENAYKKYANKQPEHNAIKKANEQGYTKTMLSPPDENGKRRKALVHQEDIDSGLAATEGWTDV